MMHAIEMLAELPGVRHVMLVGDDGVPVASSGEGATSAHFATGEAPADGELTAEEYVGSELGTEDVLAALATAFLTDLSLAVGQMSWKAPHRVVLRAARGTLVLQSMRGAVLLVLLARGLGAEELRLSMDGTIARIERTLRDMGGSSGSGGMASSAHRMEGIDKPPGPLPSAPERKSGTGTHEATGKGERGSPKTRN